MKNRILTIVILAIFSQNLNAQIGINATNTAPNPAAMLDIASSTKGLLIPRMTSAQKVAILNKPEGLIVYDTDLKQFSYWTDPGTGFVWQNFGMPSSGGGGEWSLNGSDISNTNAGNVGVGLSNPIYTRFQVNGSVGGSAAIFGGDKTGVSINADNPEVGFNYFYNGTSKTIKAGYASVLGMYPNSGDVYLGNFNSNQSGSDFGDITGFQTVLTIKQNGNVGIGTTSPNAKFDLAGNAIVSGITNITPIISNTADHGAIKIYSPETGQTLSGSQFLTIDKESIQARKQGIFPNFTLTEQNLKLNPFGGKVGIGTGNSAINSTLLVLKGTNSGDGSAVFKGTTHFSHFHYGADEDTYIRGGKNSSAVILNDIPGGRVGVGRYPTIYSLEVNGTIKSNEIIVESTWADYVFDEKYKLRTIDEMEAYILKNKHLPNIPSASEIENNGLKVGETNRKMMEKIEEMALYIIQLKKEIDILKAKN